MTSVITTGPSTITDVLSERAGRRPDDLAFTFLADDGRAVMTYAELDGLARRYAATLADRLEPGSRALLLMPQGCDFVPAFLGCLMAGVIAVPAHPLSSVRAGGQASMLRAIGAQAEPSVVLTADGDEVTERLRASGLSDVPRLTPSDLADDDGFFPGRRAERADTAFLQFTSGSTGLPKGVQVTHGGLVHNEQMIQESIGLPPGFTVVGWLPLFHDMGLIGQVLQTLYAGGHCVLMSPLSFLKRPVRWLRTISDYRAATSAAPNFAYDTCVRRIRESDCEGLDLSSWRVALNGAEPVRAATLDAFSARFARHGFDPAAFYPSYGLAEATLLVTGSDPAGPPTRLAVDGDALRRGVVQPSFDGVELVGSGTARLDREIRIVDPDTLEPVPPDRVGEIWVAGRDVAAGYWRRPAESAATFGARTSMFGDGPYLRTGDLGFLRDGELFVTGRHKDLIVVAGRNHYPQDIEDTVTATEPSVQPGSAVAFSVDDGAQERVVVVVAPTGRRTAVVAGLEQRVRVAVTAAHGLAVDEVLVVAPAAVPRTTSGKVRRRACRDAYLAGGLVAQDTDREDPR